MGNEDKYFMCRYVRKNKHPSAKSLKHYVGSFGHLQREVQNHTMQMEPMNQRQFRDPQNKRNNHFCCLAKDVNHRGFDTALFFTIIMMMVT